MTNTRNVILVGPPNVGKTSLIESYLNLSERTPPEVAATACPVFIGTLVPIPGKWVDLDVCDTAGQEKYDSMTRFHYRNADAAFVCYDSDAARDVCHWAEKVQREVQTCMIFLVATKADLLTDAQRDQLRQTSLEYRDRLGATDSYLTSAVTRDGVGELFEAAAICLDRGLVRAV
jgi:small GTP-binding protein